jgi:mono/diheme cytochrome c family protein
VLDGTGLLGITSEGKIGLGVIAGLFIVFALLASFWFPRRNPDFPGNRLGLFSLVTVVLFVATLAAVVVFAKEDEAAHGAEAAETHAGETTETDAEEAPPAGDAAAGEAVFAENGCGDCHTLEAAGASGTIGPNLDESQPDAALVEERVRDGAGAMPAFEGRLSDQQIADVTAYVVESTSG